MLKDFKKMTAISLAVIFFMGLDRFLKVLALNIPAGEFNLWSEILKFNFKANYYIAFSLPISGFWLNAAIGLIILALVFYLTLAWRSGRPGIAICLTAVILGAASNLFDRLKYGYVIDYLDLKYFTVFNLADVMITGGVFFMLAVFNKKEAV